MRPPTTPHARAHRLGALGAALCAAGLLASSTAHASGAGAFDLGPDEGWYVPAGVTLGLVAHSDDKAGSVIGGELSLVYYDALWFGLYADALHDTHRDTTRFSVGPEIGMFFAGLDLGTIIETGDTTRFGFQGRLMLTTGFLAPYIRGGVIADDDRNATFTEVGVLLKFPVGLGGVSAF